MFIFTLEYVDLFLLVTKFSLGRDLTDFIYTMLSYIYNKAE